MLKFLLFIKFTLTPYKMLQFYQNYFTTITSIQSNKKFCKFQIYFILILSTFAIIRSFHFYLFPVKNDLNIFLHYDAFYFIIPYNSRHVLLILNILNTIYFYKQLYFYPCSMFLNVTNEVLFLNKSNFLKVNFLINRNEFVKIQHFAFLLLNFTQIYTAGLGKF